MLMRISTVILLSLTISLVMAAKAMAVAQGGFLIYADAGGFGDTDKSLVVYDPNTLFFDNADPLNNPPEDIFTIFLGTESLGDTEDFSDWTVDRATGTIYVAAFDSGSSPGATTSPPGYPTDGTGDIDLLKIDFNAAYDAWVAGGKVRTDFYTANIDITNPQDHGNIVQLPGLLTKIGEVARAVPPGSGHPVEPGQIFFGQRLEFVNETTLIMLDNTTVDAVGNPGDSAAFDHEIRVIRRVATDNTSAPGFSTDAGGSNVGGSNNGTTESWESIVIGRVNLDAQGFSEPQDITYYKDPVSGVEGIWILDSDSGGTQPLVEDDGPDGIAHTADDTTGGTLGDDIAFFEINNFAGSAGNALRTISNTSGSAFNLSDDGAVPGSNNGSGDWVKIDPTTGNLYIGESGFFDVTGDGIDQDADLDASDEERGDPAFGAHEPRVITVQVGNYDDAGQITIASTSTQDLDMTGLTDDDGASIVGDGRMGTVDYANNIAFIRELDNAGDPSGKFEGDFYAVNLDTGESFFLGQDINNHANFENGRWFGYFLLRTLDGDANNDGLVTGGDLIAVQQGFGKTGTKDGTLVGDANGDGRVTGADLIAVQQGFGNVLAAPTNPVPEPAGLVLLGLLAVSLSNRGAIVLSAGRRTTV